MKLHVAMIPISSKVRRMIRVCLGVDKCIFLPVGLTNLFSLMDRSRVMTPCRISQ